MHEVKVIPGHDSYHLHRAIQSRRNGKLKSWVALTEVVVDARWTVETAKLANQRLVATKVDTLVGQMKSWWSIESHTLERCVLKWSRKDEDVLENTKSDRESYEVGLFWKNSKSHISNINN